MIIFLIFQDVKPLAFAMEESFVQFGLTDFDAEPLNQARRRDVNDQSPIGFAVRGWVDTIRALRQMPLVFGVAVCGLIILQVFLDRVPPSASDSGAIAGRTRTIVDLVTSSFLLAPLAIAMHRFVLLNETGVAYSFSFRDARFVKFYIAELIYSAIFFLPILAMIVAIDLFDRTSLAVLSAFIIIIVGIIVIALRALILFPAIAIDAPGARWRNALADSKGHTWNIFIAVFLASLPTVPTTILYSYWTPGLRSLGYYALTILSCVEQAIFLAAMAAVASHLFLTFAQRLNAR